MPMISIFRTPQREQEVLFPFGFPVGNMEMDSSETFIHIVEMSTRSANQHFYFKTAKQKANVKVASSPWGFPRRPRHMSANLLKDDKKKFTQTPFFFKIHLRMESFPPRPNPASLGLSGLQKSSCLPTGLREDQL